MSADCAGIQISPERTGDKTLSRNKDAVMKTAALECPAYLSDERRISKRGSNFCAQVELLVISDIWEETCKSAVWTLKMRTLSLKTSGRRTLAHRATVSPPYWSSSEHATGSEDRGGFRVWHQRRGWCCGALRHTHRRRAFRQCRLR